MSLAAVLTWEVRGAGSVNSGGAFSTGASGTDRSQQDAAFASGVNLTVDAVTDTDVLPAAYTPVAADVGNVIQITAGAGYTIGFYEILSIQAGKWRLDRSPAATGTAGGVWALGGALASPGKMSGAMVPGNEGHIKSATYTVTSATPNIAGGCLTLPAGASAANTTKVFGYQTTRGDGGTKPIIIADGVITAFTFITTGTNNHIENIELDGNLRATSRGALAGSTSSRFYKCRARNFTNSGFTSTLGSNWCVLCEVTGCTTQPCYANISCFACVSQNSANGYSSATNTLWVGCIAMNNTGVGFVMTGSGVVGANCVAYNCTSGYSRTASAGMSMLVNCLAVNGSLYGFTASAQDDNCYLYNCAGFNNTSGNVNTALLPVAQQIGFIDLTGDPFTNAAGGNLTLNNDGEAFGGSPGTDRRGRWLRGANFPGTLPGTSTTSSMDIGAAQHADAGTGVILSNAGLMGGLV